MGRKKSPIHKNNYSLRYYCKAAELRIYRNYKRTANLFPLSKLKPAARLPLPTAYRSILVYLYF